MLHSVKRSGIRWIAFVPRMHKIIKKKFLNLVKACRLLKKDFHFHYTEFGVTKIISFTMTGKKARCWRSFIFPAPPVLISLSATDFTVSKNIRRLKKNYSWQRCKARSCAVMLMCLERREKRKRHLQPLISSSERNYIRMMNVTVSSEEGLRREKLMSKPERDVAR